MTENTDVPSEMIKEKKEYLLFRHRHRKRHKHDADCLLVFGAFRSRSAIVSPPMPEERKTEKSSLVITNARWSVNWNEKDEALWVYCRWNCFICDLWLYKGRFFLFFYCDAFWLLLWSVSEKHSSHRARWGLSWTEQNIHLREMLKTNSELIHEIKQLNFSFHKGNTDRYETDFC